MTKGNPRSSGYERNGNDWYREPRWCVDAMLDVEKFEGPIWDPACGGGTIPEACRARGYQASGSDIVDRGFKGAGVCDFMMIPAGAANIVCNPPFDIIQPWVEHALAITTGKVAIVGRLALLEGQKRGKWFPTTPLARVWVHSRRVSMPPGGKGIKAKNGSIAYAWFVWEHGHTGSVSVGWLG